MTPHLPESLTEPFDLEDRILQAEQRLVDRQKALREDVNALARRVRGALRPRRLAVPLLGISALLVAVGWLMGRGSGSRRAPAAAVPESHEAAGWGRLIALGWPLLPQSWRDRAGPASATVATLGVPLLLRLLGSQRSMVPPSTMPYVDLARYAGTWFEIARLPAPFEALCDGQPTATYTPRGGVIEVLNRCPGPDGQERSARGIARVVPGSGGAKLEVSLWPAFLRGLRMAWADYWILHVDPGYTLALVGDPKRRFLWVLSRRPHVSPAALQRMVTIAREQGFPVEQLHVVA